MPAVPASGMGRAVVVHGVDVSTHWRLGNLATGGGLGQCCMRSPCNGAGQPTGSLLGYSGGRVCGG